METAAPPPPPKTLADRLREIPVGGTELIVGPTPVTIRSTLTRIKKEGGEYTTRPDIESGGIRVWRLS